MPLGRKGSGCVKEDCADTKVERTVPGSEYAERGETERDCSLIEIVEALRDIRSATRSDVERDR